MSTFALTPVVHPRSKKITVTQYQFDVRVWGCTFRRLSVRIVATLHHDDAACHVGIEETDKSITRGKVNG